MKQTFKIAAIVLALLFVSALAVQQAPAAGMAQQVGDKTFPETGRTVPAIFYQYWLSHGGLAQQGYPITDAKMEKNSIDGKQYLTQYFERARFEQHLEYKGTQNEVLLGLLGVEAIKARGGAGQGGASSKDAPGTSDFKFIPRPANSYITEWCITGICSDAVGAFAGDVPGLGDDLAQDVSYSMADGSAFNTDAMLRFYIDTLTKAGWSLGNNVADPPGGGQVFLPPASLKAKIQKASVYFPTPGGENKITKAVIAVLRADGNNIGNPPDLSLFQGH
ncbi:MAG: hypothetical protein IVW55_15215 [Chloroflexi bacterium]|nr:hypothetical protein [Chloroflexota bacterium]